MSYNSMQRVIDNQQSTIAIKEKEIDRLRKENEDLKRLVSTITREWNVEVPPNISLRIMPSREESWSDRSDHFAAMRSQLLEAAIALAKIKNEPLHQSEIIEEARRRNPYLLKIDESSLTARIREMCNPMELLTRVKEGWYFPSKKAIGVMTRP